MAQFLSGTKAAPLKIHLHLEGNGTRMLEISFFWELGEAFPTENGPGVGDSPSPCFITGIFPTFDAFPYFFWVPFRSCSSPAPVEV